VNTALNKNGVVATQPPAASRQPPAASRQPPADSMPIEVRDESEIKRIPVPDTPGHDTQIRRAEARTFLA